MATSLSDDATWSWTCQDAPLPADPRRTPGRPAAASLPCPLPDCSTAPNISPYFPVSLPLCLPAAIPVSLPACLPPSSLPPCLPASLPPFLARKSLACFCPLTTLSLLSRKPYAQALSSGNQPFLPSSLGPFLPPFLRPSMPRFEAFCGGLR